MNEYSDYGMVEAKLHEGMYDGNMHACLRDVGRIAGGCFAAGRLTQDELEWAKVCRDKQKAKHEYDWLF